MNDDRETTSPTNAEGRYEWTDFADPKSHAKQVRFGTGSPVPHATLMWARRIVCDAGWG